jgi:hypothetical protein
MSDLIDENLATRQRFISVWNDKLMEMQQIVEHDGLIRRIN